jgi:hypothetical protein
VTATATAVRLVRRAVVLAGLAVWSREARAQFTVSGSPALMDVSSAAPGAVPVAVSNTSTTYRIMKPRSGHYAISAHINSAMPAGVTLTATLAVGSGASSTGPVALSTISQEVVTNVSKPQNNLQITYQLSATLAAGVVPIQTRTVTFTVINTP